MVSQPFIAAAEFDLARAGTHGLSLQVEQDHAGDGAVWHADDDALLVLAAFDPQRQSGRLAYPFGLGDAAMGECRQRKSGMDEARLQILIRHHELGGVNAAPIGGGQGQQTRLFDAELGDGAV